MNRHDISRKIVIVGICTLLVTPLLFSAEVAAWNPLKKIKEKVDDVGNAIDGALQGDKNGSGLPQWYLDYREALRAKKKEDWEAAILSLNKAIERKSTPRTWRNKDGSKEGYFPYLHLGLTYLAIEEREAARKYCGISKEHGVADAQDVEDCLSAAGPPPTPEPVDETKPSPTPALTPQPAEPAQPLSVEEPDPEIPLEDIEIPIKRPDEVYAVIIGIGQYADKDIPPLQYPENDAEGLFEVLTDPKYGGIPEENVKLLLGEEATDRAIKTAIGRWLSREAHKDDMVIIFYSGHGAPEEGDTYWVTYNADIDNLYATALSNNEIFDMLNRVQVKRMVTFLDSCYSAATVNKKNRTKSLQIKIPWEKFSGAGRVTISASDGKQLSLEMEEYGHGVFTYYLLEGLKGEADGTAGTERDGVVEVEELWNYLKHKVTETARKQGNTQTPVFQGTLAARIPLTYDLEYLQEMARKRRQELKEKQQKLEELFLQGSIRADHFDCAFWMLENGQQNGFLEGLLAGDISPKTFERLFSCEDSRE